MLKIAHVNFRIPAGGEPEAEKFWCGLMGFEKLAKPVGNVHPGLWFSHGSYEVHVSPDVDFEPATRAHTAFVVEGITEQFQALRDYGVKVTVSKGTEEDVMACFVNDPFGNRLEMISPLETSMGG